MTSSLESWLVEDLQHEADQVHEPPGLAERVVARGHVVRRRRSLVAGAVAVVGVLVVAGALLSNGPTESAPPATHTPSAPPAETLSPALRLLPQGEPPGVDYVAGTTAHLGGHEVRLPADWVVNDLVDVGRRWIMIVQTPGQRLVVNVSDTGALGILDRNDPLGLAVDPTGRYVAWGSAQQVTEVKENLTVYDVTTNAVIARHPLIQPVRVQGWAKEGVIGSYRMSPGGSPIVWDPVADTVTTVWGGDDAGPTFVAYTNHSSHGGPRWVLSTPNGDCGVAIARPREQAAVPGCTYSVGSPATFFDGGRLLAATSDNSASERPAIRVFDRKLRATGTAYALPRGLVPLQIVAVGTRLLVVVADSSDGSSHVLACAVAGPCNRAVDVGRAEAIVLAHR
jgi:hypothetical protein